MEPTGQLVRQGGEASLARREGGYVKSRVWRLAHGLCTFRWAVVLGAEGVLGRVQGEAGEAGGEVTNHWVLVCAPCPLLRTVRSAEGGCPWLTPERVAHWLPWARSHLEFSFHRWSRTCEEADRCSRETWALNTELQVPQSFVSNPVGVGGEAMAARWDWKPSPRPLSSWL